MRSLRLLAAFALSLLVLPAFAADAHAPAFTPTHFVVTDAGTMGKPDVILLTDLGISTTEWEPEAGLLAPNYRLHLVQISGFGGIAPRGNAASPEETIPTVVPGIVKELSSYIVATKIHPAVIGHGLGGLMAMMLADEHPDQVSKLVLVDTLPYYPVQFSPSATVFTTKTAADSARQSIMTKTDEHLADMEKAALTGQVKDETTRRALLLSIMASDRLVLANVAYEQMQLDMRNDTLIIKTPALVLYPFDSAMQGADTKGVDAMFAKAYKPMENAKLQRVDDSRHFIMYDQPGKLDAAIESFLK